MESLPSLDDLVRLVEQVHPGAGPLQQLTDSVILAGRLAETSDELVGHFVERARETGATWADIGEQMGVTKQAAQKRFIKSPSRRGIFLTRLTDDALLLVQKAAAHARGSGSEKVGTEHLVGGLVEDRESRACRVIVGLGGSPDRLAARAAAGEGRQGGSGRHIPFSASAKKVLELALREAIYRGERRIGTEHVLLAILRDQRSPGAQLLAEEGVTGEAVEGWIESDPSDP